MGKYSVSYNTVYIVNDDLGVLPRPCSKVATEELYIGELILKGSLTDLGSGNLQIALYDRKSTFMYDIVYIFIGISDAYLVFADLCSELRCADPDAEKIDI